MIHNGYDGYLLLFAAVMVVVGLFFLGRFWVREASDRYLLSQLRRVVVIGKETSYPYGELVQQGHYGHVFVPNDVPCYELTIKGEVISRGELRACRTVVEVDKSVYDRAELHKPIANPLFVG